MDDFEYSVDICDRDWECFFAECEECDLLSPSIAGVDDSGMSDIDDTASILAKRVQKGNPTAGFSEADCPIDGPQDCDGSPVEHYLCTHGAGGMESILSGSEEDIHQQSVNIFFERLKNATEADGFIDPSQVSAGKNRDTLQEEEHCSDGQPASSTALPKNIPKLDSLPARGQTAVGEETAEPVDTISSIMKTMKKEKSASNIFPECAASNSGLKSAPPQAQLFIIETSCTETRLNEATRWSQSHESPLSVQTTPYSGQVIKEDLCTPLEDVKQEDLLTSQLTLSKKCSRDSWSYPEMVTNVNWKEERNTASQESSPSASIKRKRRKRRRLSVEPAEGVRGNERQVKPSDSEEELYALRGGTVLCISEDLFHSNKPQKYVPSSVATCSVETITAEEVKVNDLSQHGPSCGSFVRQREATGLAEGNETHGRSRPTLSETDDGMLASVSSGNVATDLLPCWLRKEESTGLNKHHGRPVSVTDGVTGESNPTSEKANGGGKDAHVGSLYQADKINPSIVCENDQSCRVKVKSLAHSILPSTESTDPTLEVLQNVKLSAAKLVLAEEAGYSGRDAPLCQREAEPQRQLEIGCHYTNQYRLTHFSLPAGWTSSSDTKPKQFETKACPFLEGILTQVDWAKSTLDTSSSLPDKYCLSKSPSSLGVSIPVEQTEHPVVAKLDVSEKNTKTERAESPELPITALFSEMNLSPRETRSSMSEDIPTSPSDITPVSSCCTPLTESVTSHSNGNITDLSGSSCVSAAQNDSRGQGESVILAQQADRDDLSEPKSKSKYDLALQAGCEPDKAPASKHSVFAISSFWSEMEKLTINDILGLRMISKAASSGSLQALEESEQIDGIARIDSGFFTPLDEDKPEHTNEDTSRDLNAIESSSGSVAHRGVMWDSEPAPVDVGADICTGNMLLKPVCDTSKPILPGIDQKCPRQMWKNVSVHNLPALESASYTWRRQTLQTLDEEEKVDNFTDGRMPEQDNHVDCLASSTTDGYRISLTNIFQYLFGGKRSYPSQAAADYTCYTDGNSVPETYDHFFSEFDTESFFYPLIATEDQAKDELAPVSSVSRSANRNLQFPEAYDYFFASSSSDESSLESDEEEDCEHVRVVNRFNCKSSASKISTDVYDNFFTDGDLQQNFFWKNSLSFRNVSFSRSTVRTQTLSNPAVCVRPSGRTLHSINARGHKDGMFSDPLVHHVEDRISRNISQQLVRCEDSQMAVSNPRLDASLLPLKQSDMCLVCIAFASWVLKTANPQVGDAWKAVLLANVSALSAIRYLRKYVKVEAATSEGKLCLCPPSDS